MSTLDLWQEFLPALVQGAIVSIGLLVLSTALSVAIGLLGALSLLWAPGPLRLLWRAYVEVVRSTPPIVDIFVIYYALPEIGITLPAFVAGIVALSFVGGAFFVEIFRGGIDGVDRGQGEAAVALGMGRFAVMRFVVLPQAATLALAPSVNLVTDLLKTTAVVVTIGISDIMYQTYNAASATFRYMELYILAALVYLAIALPLIRLSGRLEKVATRHRG